MQFGFWLHAGVGGRGSERVALPASLRFLIWVPLDSDVSHYGRELEEEDEGRDIPSGLAEFKGQKGTWRYW